jgi:Flp pilus assembly protein CpaB
MRLTIIGLILLGTIAAVSAAVLTATLRSDTPEVEVQAREVQVLIAARDLPAMTIVDSQSIGTMTVPADEVPEGSLRSTVQVIGQVLAVPIVEGQVFNRANFVSDEAAVHLASALPEGGRAMTILLPESSGVETLLYPGAIVDVVASFRMPGIHGGTIGEVVSATLFQGVRVLSVGSRSIVTAKDSEDSGGPAPNIVEGRRGRRVTLLVDHEQAEALQLATGHGTIALVLRNPLDTNVNPAAGVLLSDLSDEIAARLAALTEVEMASSPLTVNTTNQVEKNKLTAPTGLLTPNEPAPAEPSEAEPGSAPAPEALQWRTIVLRGNAVESLVFPATEKTGRPAAEQPETEG